MTSSVKNAVQSALVPKEIEDHDTSIVLPWKHISESIQNVTDNHFSEKMVEWECMNRIEELSKHESTFFMDVPETFIFNLEKEESVALALLNNDSELNTMRHNLVPNKLSEYNFWKSYFFCIDIIMNILIQEVVNGNLKSSTKCILNANVQSSTVQAQILGAKQGNSDRNLFQGPFSSVKLKSNLTSPNNKNNITLDKSSINKLISPPPPATSSPSLSNNELLQMDFDEFFKD